MNISDIKCRIMEEELRTFWPQWHVVKRLGSGSFGDVFQICTDESGRHQDAALKVIQMTDSVADNAVPQPDPAPNGSGSGQTQPDRAPNSSGTGRAQSISQYGQNVSGNIPKVFRNEIQIMEALRGAPNIVSIDDFYFQRGGGMCTLYVRMELLTSFKDVMLSRQNTAPLFSVSEVLKLGMDVCTALMYCEQRGIIHRDIKPENLFVDNSGNFKVGDFGASKRVESVHPTHTMTGIGTISYMAPEVFAGLHYNNTVDIYALGMVLYQLLNNGRMPFLPASGSYTTQEVDRANYMRLHGEPIPSLEGVRVGNEVIDAMLDGIIRNACNPDKNYRYRTANEFYDELTHYATWHKMRAEGAGARQGAYQHQPDAWQNAGAQQAGAQRGANDWQQAGAKRSANDWQQEGTQRSANAWQQAGAQRGTNAWQQEGAQHQPGTTKGQAFEELLIRSEKPRRIIYVLFALILAAYALFHYGTNPKSLSHWIDYTGLLLSLFPALSLILIRLPKIPYVSASLCCLGGMASGIVVLFLFAMLAGVFRSFSSQLIFGIVFLILLLATAFMNGVTAVTWLDDNSEKKK